MCKYKVEELSRFNDRLQNVLLNDRCIKDFKQFLKCHPEDRFYDTFKIWKGVTKAITKRKTVHRKVRELMNRMDWIDEADKHNLEVVQERAYNELEYVHGEFIVYLKTLK